MNKQLLETLKKQPVAYEATGLPFWDDEYISARMLEAHLDPDAEGATRPHAFLDASAKWIAGLCPKGAALLDVGCGPGLYAERFHDAGPRVTGVDFSRRSIEYATAHAEETGRDIRYRYLDYLRMEYSAAFDAAVLIYCDYGALSPQNRARVLGKVYEALKPGGLFVLDAFTPAQYAGFENRELVQYEDGGFWAAEPYVNIKRERRYPDGDYLEQYVIVTGDTCQTYNLWNHAFSQAALGCELEAAGFAVAGWYGDVAGKALEQGQTTICAVCKK